jgi:predicted Zn-dependent peptidase
MNIHSIKFMASSEIKNVQKTTLPGGMRVITETIDAVRSLTVGVWVKTGSRDETDDQAGITHFLEHMLFKGTQTRSAYDLVQTMESVGGYLNAFTSTEYTCYYSRCLDTELERALDILSDMVLNSTLPDKEIEKEKKVVIEEMKMYRDSPDDYIFEQFNGLVFEGHPLGRPIIGFEKTVNGFTRDDLNTYIQQRYHPSNLIIAVAGNATHEKVLEMVRRFFPERNADFTPLAEVPLNGYSKKRKEVTKVIEQTHLIVGRRGLSTDHPDRYKLFIANTVLGGGMSSRLHQNIREQYGYCYSVQSFNQSYKDTGMFGVYVGTDKEYVNHVQELVYKELDTLIHENISDKELIEAKAQLKGKLLLAQESMSNRMTRLAKSELYYDRYITLDELVDEIDSVTSDEIRTFASEFFKEEHYTETVLIPES